MRPRRRAAFRFPGADAGATLPGRRRFGGSGRGPAARGGVRSGVGASPMMAKKPVWAARRVPPWAGCSAEQAERTGW